MYVGARSSLAVGLPGPTTPATRVHFARSCRPYGSIGVLLAVGRQAFAAFENLALIFDAEGVGIAFSFFALG